MWLPYAQLTMMELNWLIKSRLEKSLRIALAGNYVPYFAIRQRQRQGRLSNKTFRPMTHQHMSWSFH